MFKGKNSVGKAFRTTLLSLLVCLLFTLFCGCDVIDMVMGELGIGTGTAGDNSEITDPNVTEEFACNGLTLRLPGDFRKVEESFGHSYTVKYTNDAHLIRVYTYNKSNITTQPGHSFPSVEETMNTILFKEDLPFVDTYGVLCADYTATRNTAGSVFPIEEEEGTQLIVLFEDELRFYAVSFYGANLEYATVRNQYISWARSITVTPAETPPANGNNA